MRHDPERAAAAYLGGELRRRQRERFEAHILECEDCWHEVGAAQQGRALAESMREVAPQRLRERVRATVAATPLRPRRRLRVPLTLGGVVVALVLVAVAVGSLLPRQPSAPAQPAPIAAAVAAYRAGGGDWTPTTDPPPAQEIAGLHWEGSGRGRLGGLPVVAHTFQDADGDEVMLLRTDQPFPQAAGAHLEPGDATWVADVDGVMLLCADRPPSLLVGSDRATVLLLASALRLG